MKSARSVRSARAGRSTAIAASAAVLGVLAAFASAGQAAADNRSTFLLSSRNTDQALAALGTTSGARLTTAKFDADQPGQEWVITQPFGVDGPIAIESGQSGKCVSARELLAPVTLQDCNREDAHQLWLESGSGQQRVFLNQAFQAKSGVLRMNLPGQDIVLGEFDLSDHQQWADITNL